MSSEEDILNEVNAIKKTANEFFINKNYTEANQQYTKAINLLLPLNIPSNHKLYSILNSTIVILYTNRAASFIGLKQYQFALDDSNQAIQRDPTWVKGYYRKASALEGIGLDMEASNKELIGPQTNENNGEKVSESEESTEDKSPTNMLMLTYYTWYDALKSCKNDDQLLKHYNACKKKFLLHIFNLPILNSNDFIHRYTLLTNKRDRLSTLAYLWNISSTQSRYNFIKLLFEVVSTLKNFISEESLASIPHTFFSEMPMDNYADLPQERIHEWCRFYKRISEGEKEELLKRIWLNLTREEQKDVVLDIIVFIQGGGPQALLPKKDQEINELENNVEKIKIVEQ